LFVISSYVSSCPHVASVRASQTQAVPPEQVSDDDDEDNGGGPPKEQRRGGANERRVTRALDLKPVLFRAKKERLRTRCAVLIKAAFGR
ncbi:hypothetical protein GN956_G27326, partial [Arapaima gigas]